MAQIWFERAYLPHGWASKVRVTFSSAIETIEEGVAPAPEDDRRAIGVPGLCNVHSHGFQRALLAETRGPDGDNFWTWRAEMYRFLERLTPEDVRAITAQAYAEMLESGFTRVGEFHYLHHDPDGAPYADRALMAKAVATAAEDSGIGLTLLPVLYAHSDFGGAPPTEGQRRFICDQDGFAHLVEDCRGVVADLPGARLGVAPHSLRAVTLEELRFAATLVLDGPVHIHVAEQSKEVAACERWCGKTPGELLFENADINARWTFIHATHLRAREIERLAASGAQAGLCPITESNLGDGIFQTEDYVNEGGAFGIGTDCNIAIDAALELRTLEYAQRLRHEARNVLSNTRARSTGANIFAKALAGGGSALGVSTGIAVGAPADFVALSPRHPSLIGREGDAILDAWIFSAGKAAVDGVWAGGRLCVDNGRAISAGAIEASYARAIRRLMA